MVEIQKLSSTLEAKLCTKIRANRWQAFMKSINLSIVNVHLLDINVFAKFYVIPSLPFQDIEKPKCCEWKE